MSPDSSPIQRLQAPYCLDQQPGEDLAHQIAFPRFLGEATSPMLEYELARIPQELVQGQKMAVNLRPPSYDHWNIVSDLILPLIQGTLQQRCEAKQVALHQEEGSEGAEASPTEVSAPEKSLQMEAESSREAFPGGSVLQAACDRDYAGDLSMHPRSPPPDYALDGECVGAGSDSSSHTHG